MRLTAHCAPENSTARWRCSSRRSPLAGRSHLRKDFAYALLKAGEREQARGQFAEALRIDPNDEQSALEYGFLCYETKQPVQARRIFQHWKGWAPNRRAPKRPRLSRVSTARCGKESTAGRLLWRRRRTNGRPTKSWPGWPSSGMSWRWRRSIIRRPGSFIRPSGG